jgi:hypothetical protein
MNDTQHQLAGFCRYQAFRTLDRICMAVDEADLRASQTEFMFWWDLENRLIADRTANARRLCRSVLDVAPRSFLSPWIDAVLREIEGAV